MSSRGMSVRNTNNGRVGRATRVRRAANESSQRRIATVVDSRRESSSESSSDGSSEGSSGDSTVPDSGPLSAVGRQSRESMLNVVRAWESQGNARLRLLRWADPRTVPQAEEGPVGGGGGGEDDEASYEDVEDDEDESTGSLRDFIVDDEEEDEGARQEDTGAQEEDEYTGQNDELVQSGERRQRRRDGGGDDVHDEEEKTNEQPDGGDNRDDNTCVVCEEAACNACINPCGHAMFCFACLYSLERTAQSERKIFACPTCRGRVRNVIKLYRR